MVSVMSVTPQRSTHELLKKVVLENKGRYRLFGQFANAVDALAIATERKPDIILIRSHMLFITLEEFIRALTVKGIYCAYIILDSNVENADFGKSEQGGQIVAWLDENCLTENRMAELLEQALPALENSLVSAFNSWMPYNDYNDTDELNSWLKEIQYFGAVISNQVTLPTFEQTPTFLRCTQGFLVIFALQLRNENSSFSIWQNLGLLKKLMIASQIQLNKCNGYHFFILHDKKLCFWIDATCGFEGLLWEIDQLRNNLYSILDDPALTSMTAYCGEQPVTLDLLGQEYRAVDRLCKYHFFVDDRVILYSGWLTEHSITPSNDGIQYCFNLLSESFQNFDRKAYFSSIDYLFSFIEQSLSFQTYFYIWNQLILWYCVAYERFGFSYEHSIVDVNQNNYPTLAAAKADFYHQLTRLFDEAALRAIPTQNAYVAHALSFCDAHISEDFNLSDVAKAVGLSSSYLSHLFQKELGKSFVEVRATRKIAQAKTLLEHHKVYEVAQMLSFQDVKYFSRIFKRITGMSPNAYQNSLKHHSGGTEGGQNS